MSGYGGPDDEAKHALILAENGVQASQSMVEGPVLTECQDCGETINPLRVEAMRKINMRCLYCIKCQPSHDNPGSIKMLNHIL